MCSSCDFTNGNSIMLRSNKMNLSSKKVFVDYDEVMLCEFFWSFYILSALGWSVVALMSTTVYM